MIPSEVLASVRLVVFDFDGVFTDNTVIVSQDGTESVRCWRSDGLGLSRLAAVGIPACIVSTEKNPVVSQRAQKLKIECRQGVDDKARAVLELCRDKGVDPRDAAFVGNDINDIPAFRVVGVPIAVADAYPEVLPHAPHRTTRPGGLGAVREVCDWIVAARRLTSPGA